MPDKFHPLNKIVWHSTEGQFILTNLIQLLSETVVWLGLTCIKYGKSFVTKDIEVYIEVKFQKYRYQTDSMW
jgi:hypothetical protein